MSRYTLSPAAMQALRHIVQHVAEELYPDVYESAITGAMLEPLRDEPNVTRRLRRSLAARWIRGDANLGRSAVNLRYFLRHIGRASCAFCGHGRCILRRPQSKNAHHARSSLPVTRFGTRRSRVRIPPPRLERSTGSERDEERLTDVAVCLQVQAIIASGRILPHAIVGA
jgi:plasmid stabilization system protein ParE